MNLLIKSTDKVIRTFAFGFVISFCLTTTSAFAQYSDKPIVNAERISGELTIQSPIRLSSNPTNLDSFKSDSRADTSWRVNNEAVESRGAQEVARTTTAKELQVESAKDQSGQADDDGQQNQSRQRPDFGAWPKKGIRGIAIGIQETNANAPEDVSGQLIASSKSNWTQFTPTQKVFAWAAPNIRYQPLYFEDVALERYGQTLPAYRQSLKSSVHFFKSVVFLPHKMRHDLPSSCDYPLGFCRPGDSTPTIYQRHYFGQPGR